MEDVRSTSGGWRLAAIALTIAALLLHGYEQLVKSSAPSIGWLLWAMLPYALCVAVLAKSRSALPATLGALVALAWDIRTYYSVFVHPTSSTAALAMIVMPLWNTLLFVPAAMLVAWLPMRMAQRNHRVD